MLDLPIAGTFSQRFQQVPQLFRSPGRINLIGEHVDYHDGFVLPAAIHFELNFAIAPAAGREGVLVADDLGEEVSYHLDRLAPSPVGWANYLLGVMAQLQEAGHQFPAVNVAFGGNIPSGAGMSSSAAVECGLALALNEQFNLGLDRLALAQCAQRAEHSYAGVRCGLMDPFACLFGQADHVVRLDCRSLDYAYFPFPARDWSLVLMDTRVKHALSDSGYNQRRSEAEAGLAVLQRHYPEVQALRDATPAMLAAHAEEMGAVAERRCAFVVAEIERVMHACEALENGDLAQVGELMYASHEGLQHQYEVSCPELDCLVEASRALPQVLGARMMGGGFGGCTINLVPHGQERMGVAALSQPFQERFGYAPGSYLTQISAGASALLPNA
jgi:galactokinase